MQLPDYDTQHFFDEMVDENNQIRKGYELFFSTLNKLGMPEIKRRQQAAERSFLNMGITFNVYQEGADIERIFPFDVIPRIIENQEWQTLEKGLQQRIHALNIFLRDIYNDQKIIKDKIIPADIITSSPGFLPACMGIRPPRNIWIHITGTDLIKHRDGCYYVLEDNLRVPSGVSYVLGNREIMKRSFPQVFEAAKVQPVVDYPLRLLEALQFLIKKESPQAAVLTPGIYNSAYFEHSYLAQQMGIHLVEGKDLVVKNHYVYMRTTQGLQKLDILYRRVDDIFMDPTQFRSDSLLGIPGIFDAWKKRHIALANALGTGVADDKVIYTYVPQIIKYYLNEDPIIPNVPTYKCWDEKERQYVLDNIENMVIKAANQAGGYGMLIGSDSTPEQREAFKQKILTNPREYIGQPIMSLSRVPTLVDDHLEGRHVDLRPYIIYGRQISVIPGGLTRVALRKGSLVVNSSQGGGSKDTWVLRDETPSPAKGAR